MNSGIIIILFALCASSKLCVFASGASGASSSCVPQFLLRFHELERKMDLLLQFNEKNKKSDVGCADAGVSSLVTPGANPDLNPNPNQDPTTTQIVPTAYPDNVFLPDVSPPPLAQKMIITRGYEVRLPCTVGNVNAQVDWFVGSDRIASGYYAYSLDLRIGVQRPWPHLWYLNIASVAPSDQGLYSCVADGQTTRILLIVAEPGYTTITANEGSSLSVPCTLIERSFIYPANESSIVWSGPAINAKSQKQAGQQSANRVAVNDVTGDLEFKSVTREDSGNYTCNAEGRFLPRAIYHVVVKIAAEPPVLTDEDDLVDITAANGRSVTLACFAKGKPCPAVSWRHEDVDVTETSACSGDLNTAFLTLNNMTSVSKLVTCVATNDYGASERQIFVRGETPALVHAPRDVVTSQNSYVAIFHCQAYDNHPPDIYWVKRLPGDKVGKLIQGQGSRRYKVVSPSDGESVLVVDPVRKKMNGARFTCVARRARGSANATMGTPRQAIEATASLKLHGPSNPEGFPEVNIYIGTKYLDTSIVVEVTCTAGPALPCPRISWYLGNVKFVQDFADPRISVADGPCESKLTVKKPRLEDNVRYRCSAENSHGIAYSRERRRAARSWTLGRRRGGYGRGVPSDV